VSTRQRLADCGAVASSVTPPRIAASGALRPIDLGDAAWPDELTLEDVHLTGEARESNVRNLELSAVHPDGVDLAGGRLPRLSLRNCRITGGSLANVSVRAGSAERCAFERVRLTGMLWPEGVLRDVSFHGCRIDLASFPATRLERVRFEDCSLAQTDLQEARLAAVMFTDCDLRAIDLSGARVDAGCELRGCDLEGARAVERLRGARMPYTDVLAAAATFAGALGIGIIAVDEREDR
jgi:uncharacterized protein YjbI with pentapeptide repeats